jgi:hypothetical protein
LSARSSSYRQDVVNPARRCVRSRFTPWAKRAMWDALRAPASVQGREPEAAQL